MFHVDQIMTEKPYLLLKIDFEQMINHKMTMKVTGERKKILDKVFMQSEVTELWPIGHW